MIGTAIVCVIGFLFLLRKQPTAVAVATTAVLTAVVCLAGATGSDMKELVFIVLCVAVVDFINEVPFRRIVISAVVCFVIVLILMHVPSWVGWVLIALVALSVILRSRRSQLGR